MVRTHLLILDDEPANIVVMREILGDSLRLAMATSGSSALAAARRLEPGLILLDVQLPDIDGYQVCRTLKADPATLPIPVIFVTSRGDVLYEAEGFPAGAVDYITKPISPPILRSQVRTHLSLVGVTRLEQSYRDAITMLCVAAEHKDPDTGIHIWRMAAYARALAAASGWPQEDCSLLKTAAPMHNTGKIGIPGVILRKPCRLDANEWELMKGHAIPAGHHGQRLRTAGRPGPHPALQPGRPAPHRVSVRGTEG